MKIKKFFLNFFILLIGVIIVSPLFFSTPVHAATDPYTLNPTFTKFDNITSATLYVDLKTNNSPSDHTTITRFTLTCETNVSFSNYRKIWHVYYRIAGTDYDYWTIPNYTTAANNGYGQFVIDIPTKVNVVTGLYPATISNYDVYRIDAYDYQPNDFSLDFINIPVTYQGLTRDFTTFDTQPNQNCNGRYFSLGNFNFSDKSDALFKLMVPVTGVTIDGSKIRLWTFNRLNELVEIPLTHYLYQESRYYSILYFSLSDEFKFPKVPLDNMPLYITFGINTAFYYNVQTYPIKFQYIPFDSDDYYYLYNWMNSNVYYTQNIEKPEESTNVDSSNDSFSSSSQQMMDLEDMLQGDFNSAIGSIDIPSNPFNDFGTAFGNSSRFLVYMFDQLTIHNNSPFGTVITFSLILGLAMLMIGKKGSK